MTDDAWRDLAEPFDAAYDSVKGRVRTFVLHQHVTRHLLAAPARVLDVGGGAAHQSLPLARSGYEVTLLDSSATMLDKARQRIAAQPEYIRQRMRLVEAPGEEAFEATGRRPFDAVLCHGVLMYLPDPDPLLRQLCRCVQPGGVVSLMALNAATMAVRPALEGDWRAALAAFDNDRETGVLGAPTRGDTVEDLSHRLRANGVEPQAWYGVWLFCDWMDLSAADTDIKAVAEVELEASQRDPYRQLSRVFHLVGRRRDE